jgi:hypothetical protein
MFRSYQYPTCHYGRILPCTTPFLYQYLNLGSLSIQWTFENVESDDAILWCKRYNGHKPTRATQFRAIPAEAKEGPPQTINALGLVNHTLRPGS